MANSINYKDKGLPHPKRQKRTPPPDQREMEGVGGWKKTPSWTGEIASSPSLSFSCHSERSPCDPRARTESKDLLVMTSLPPPKPDTRYPIPKFPQRPIHDVLPAAVTVRRLRRGRTEQRAELPRKIIYGSLDFGFWLCYIVGCVMGTYGER